MTKSFALAAVLVALATPALADCLHQDQTETVMVMGSPVKVNPSTVIVGDCNASVAELTADYVAADKAQAVIKIKRNKEGRVIKNGDY